MLDPWGGERGDLQAGIIASTIAQVNAAKGKRFKPADFMPKFGARRGRRQSADEIQHELRSVCAALTGRCKGGRVSNGNNDRAHGGDPLGEHQAV